MPEVSQETLDAIEKAMAGVKQKLEQQQNIKFVSREVTSLLIAGLKPVFSQFEGTIRTALMNYLSEIKNIKIVTPPIGVQDIKATVNANISTEALETAFGKILQDIKQIIVTVKQGQANSNRALLKAIRDIKPEITVRPEIKIPEIKIPAIKLPKVQNLDTSAIYKAVNNDKAKPLPVILTDEKGKFYKALMTAISSSGGGGGGSFEALKSVSTPVVNNTLLAAADTQYSVVISKGTKKFKIYAVDSSRIRPHSDVLRYSYIALGAGSWAAKTCVVIPRGNFEKEEGLELKAATTLYFSSPTGGNAVVIVVAWQ